MTADKHFIFIINEYSGKGNLTIPRLTRILDNHSITYDIHKTNAQGHAIQLAKRLGKEIKSHERLVAVGGDGTLNEVVTGLQEANVDVPLAYVPAGSGNDFARSQGLARRIEKAMNHILECSHPKELDVLKVSDGKQTHFAVNSLGFGIDGMVNQKLYTSKDRLKRKKSSYIRTVISAFSEQSAFGVSIDNGQEHVLFNETFLALSVNNPFFAGGIHIHPKASAEDGLFQLLIIEKINFFEMLHIVVRVLLNGSHLSHKKIHSFSFSHCTLQIMSEQFGQKDGELIEKGKYTLDIRTQKRKFWL